MYSNYRLHYTVVFKHDVLYTASQHSGTSRTNQGSLTLSIHFVQSPDAMVFKWSPVFAISNSQYEYDFLGLLNHAGVPQIKGEAGFENMGTIGNLGQSTLPNSCAPTTYTETGGPDLAKWGGYKSWGCYIHESTKGGSFLSDTVPGIWMDWKLVWK